MQLVASSLPPIPTSSTAIWQSKQLECHQGQHLEHNRCSAQLLAHLLYPLHRLNQLLIGNRFSCDLKPLVVPLQMRGGVQSAAQTRVVEYRGKHRGSGAFAVGARNVDIGHLLLRVAHQMQCLF